MVITPKISIVIPVYNVSRYLSYCLDSVINQTFTDFEVICVNDGSTDDSPSILSRYEQQDMRFKIIHQENQGLSMARNAGVKKACGQYIYFLDSDDMIHCQLLSLTYTLATRHDAKLVAFNFLECYSQDMLLDIMKKQKVSCYHIDDIIVKSINKPLSYKFKKIKLHRRYRLHIMTWCKLYDAQLIRDIPFIPNVAFEDNPFAVSVFLKQPKTIILNEKLYYYNKINENSITRQSFNLKYLYSYSKIFETIYHELCYANKMDKNRVLRVFFPRLLKREFNRIKKVSLDEQLILWPEFAKQLQMLKNKKALSVFNMGILMYFRYKKVLSKYL